MAAHKNKELFFTFLKIGAFTFGGGYAMIPLIHKEAVENYHWVDDEEILDILAIAESTPGPLAVNSATFIGYKIGGFWGSFLATFGVILPSFCTILIISLFYEAFRSNIWVNYGFLGIRAGVAVLLINTCLKLFKPLPKNLFNILLIILALIATAVFDIDTIIIILAGAGLGLLYNIFFTASRKGGGK